MQLTSKQVAKVPQESTNLTLRVTGLPANTTASDLDTYFRLFGPIDCCGVGRRSSSRASSSSTKYVTFLNQKSVNRVMKYENHVFEGKKVEVTIM